MKILFACSECSPFAASGGLADVACAFRWKGVIEIV